MTNKNNNSSDSIKNLNDLLKSLTLNLSGMTYDKLEDFAADVDKHNIELIQKMLKTIVLAIKNGEIDINDIDVDAISANFFERKETNDDDDDDYTGCFGLNIERITGISIFKKMASHISPDADEIFLRIFGTKVYDKNQDGLPSKYTCKPCKEKFGGCLLEYVNESYEDLSLPF